MFFRSQAECLSENLNESARSTISDVMPSTCKHHFDWKEVLLYIRTQKLEVKTTTSYNVKFFFLLTQISFKRKSSISSGFYSDQTVTVLLLASLRVQTSPPRFKLEIIVCSYLWNHSSFRNFCLSKMKKQQQKQQKKTWYITRAFTFPASLLLLLLSSRCQRRDTETGKIGNHSLAGKCCPAKPDHREPPKQWFCVKQTDPAMSTNHL